MSRLSCLQPDWSEVWSGLFALSGLVHVCLLRFLVRIAEFSTVDLHETVAANDLCAACSFSEALSEPCSHMLAFAILNHSCVSPRRRKRNTVRRSDRTALARPPATATTADPRSDRAPRAASRAITRAPRCRRQYTPPPIGCQVGQLPVVSRTEFANLPNVAETAGISEVQIRIGIRSGTPCAGGAPIGNLAWIGILSEAAAKQAEAADVAKTTSGVGGGAAEAAHHPDADGAEPHRHTMLCEPTGVPDGHCRYWHQIDR